MRIKRLMVAVISVMLILVTTISYIALPPAFAEGEEQAQEQAAPAEGETAAPAEGEAADPAAQPAAEGEAAPAEGEAAQPAEGDAAQPAEGAEGEQTTTVSLPAISASSYIVMSGSTSE